MAKFSFDLLGHLSVEFLADRSITVMDAENFDKFEKIVEKLSTAIDDLKSSHAQVLDRLLHCSNVGFLKIQYKTTTCKKNQPRYHYRIRDIPVLNVQMVS